MIMKNTIKSLVILLSAFSFLFASDKGDNADENQYASLSHEIVTDPVSGDKVYINQLMIAFKEDVTENERKSIIENYNVRLLSSAPSLNIYHVAFVNPDRSLSKLNKKKVLLERNSKILYACPRRQISFDDDSATIFKDQGIQRSGEITLTQLNSSSDKYKPKTVNEAIKQHQDALSSCIERKYRNNNRYHGKVSFSLTLNAYGDVTSVHIVKTTSGDKKLTSCLLKKVKAWRDFPADPKKRDKRTVNFTFVY
jgi:TonB family protein